VFAELVADERAGGEARRGAEESRAHYGAAAMARRIARRAKLGAGVDTEEAQSDAADQTAFLPIGRMRLWSGKSITELYGKGGWERRHEPLGCGGADADQADKHKDGKEFEPHP